MSLSAADACPNRRGSCASVLLTLALVVLGGCVSGTPRAGHFASPRPLRLESGSQRVADRMKKGVQLDQVSEFIKRAKIAGISIRCTMIIGYPDETHVDIDASSAFLANHTADIERIHLNRLAMISGTPLVRQIKRDPNRYKGFRIVAEDGAMANVEHFYDAVGQRPHRSAVRKLLGEVFKINAQEMSLGAQDFEGVM